MKLKTVKLRLVEGIIHWDTCNCWHYTAYKHVRHKDNIYIIVFYKNIYFGLIEIKIAKVYYKIN